MATPVTQIPAETLNRQNPYEAEKPAGFADFLRSLTVKLAAEDMMVNRSENRRAALVQNFYRGNQRGTISPYDLSFLPLPSKNRADPRLIHNWFRPMSRAITGQWTLARTDTVVLPLPTDSHDAHVAGAARYATRLAERLQSLIMTESWRQTRAKYAQFAGMNAFYSYWDMKGSIDVAGSRYAPMATKPVVEMREMAISQGGYLCDECGYGGPIEEAEGLQSCPACGSPDLTVEQPATAQMPVVTGYEKHPLGFLCCRQVPRWQLKWDRMASTLAESSYLLWEFPMRDEVIREAYPWWRGKNATAQDDRGSQRTEFELRNQPGNVPAWGNPSRSPRTGQSIVRNWWLSPCLYREARLDGYRLAIGMDENGQVQYETFDPGTRAIDKYPTGLFITMVGMDTLGLVDEEKTDHWLISAYDLIPGQIGGDGIEDAIPAQRHINKVKALKDANLENCAGAGALYHPLYIDRADVPSSPFDCSPVKASTPPDINLKTSVVAHIERPPLAGDALVQDQESIQEMQYQMGAGPGVTGQPDIAGLNSSDTATEAMIQSQGAKSQRSPELALASEADCGLMTQWLRLFQKHATDEIAVPMKGENGEFDWECFKGAMIPANFLVTTRTRGSAPKSDEDLQADFKAALAIVGGVEGLAILSQQFPQLVEQVEERFGVDFKLNNLGRIAALVRYRLDIITAELQKLGQTPLDPNQVALLLPQDPRITPDPEEPHELFIAKYKEWLLSDEAMKARTEMPAKLTAVHAMIQLHKTGGIAQEQEKAEAVIEANAPMQEMQEEQMERQQAGEQQNAMMQAAQASDDARAQQVVQSQEAEAQRQHERSMAQDKNQNTLEIERLRGKVQEKRMSRAPRRR